MRCRRAVLAAPAGSTARDISNLPVAVLSPTSLWLAFPPNSSSATAKISPRAGSMTGVPVMPTVGRMSPQGSSDDGTGLATWVDHTTAPVAAASA